MTLEELRNEIDRIDLEILDLLRKRIETVKTLGSIKAEVGLPLIDKRREAIIMNRVLDARREPLSVESVRGVFEAIIIESRRVQVALSDKAKTEFFQTI